MDIKRFWSALLSCVLVFCCFVVPAEAADIPDGGIAMPLVSGYLNQNIPANSIIRIGGKVCLTDGDTISIDCTYTSNRASVDFGVIDSDNVFHYLRFTGGVACKTITIDKTGEYSVAIRNNAPYEITISGDVRY